MLKHIPVETINEIAAMSQAARDDQDRLINRMRVMDRNKDGDLIMEEIGSSLESPDATTANAPLRRLRDRVERLSVAERTELMAAIYVGRGDFAAEEWDEAMAQARANEDAGAVDRIVEKVSLREYLKKALYALRLS